jgi:hypothetical protein
VLGNGPRQTREGVLEVFIDRFIEEYGPVNIIVQKKSP